MNASNVERITKRALRVCTPPSRSTRHGAGQGSSSSSLLPDPLRSDGNGSPTVARQRRYEYLVEWAGRVSSPSWISREVLVNSARRGLVLEFDEAADEAEGEAELAARLPPIRSGGGSAAKGAREVAGGGASGTDVAAVAQPEADTTLPKPK